MSVQPLTTVWTLGDRNGITTWDSAATADTYAPLQLKAVIADVIFGVEGLADTAVELHGSVDATNYYKLKDADGSSISLAADGLVEVRAAPPYFKPVNSGGTDAAIICTLHHAKVYA